MSKTDERWFIKIFLALREVTASAETLLRKTVRLAFSSSDEAESAPLASDS